MRWHEQPKLWGLSDKSICTYPFSAPVFVYIYNLFLKSATLPAALFMLIFFNWAEMFTRLSEVLLWCYERTPTLLCHQERLLSCSFQAIIARCKSRINTRSVYVSPSLQRQQQQRSRNGHLCFYSRKTTTYVNKAQTTHMCALINHKVTQIHLIQTSGCRWMNTWCIRHVFFY